MQALITRKLLNRTPYYRVLIGNPQLRSPRRPVFGRTRGLKPNETRLLKLPYISEAYVLPIMDYEARELVAAVIRLKDEVSNDVRSEVNLRKIRDDLALTTESYKLPRVLRVLQEGEKIPMTPSEKARKNEIREKYFKLSGYRPTDYTVPGVEFYRNEVDSNFFANAKQQPSST